MPLQDIHMGFIQRNYERVMAYTVPINPQQITFEDGRNINVLDMADATQVATIGSRKLQTVEFESHFPAQHDIYLDTPGLDQDITPEVWIQFFRTHLQSRKPMKFFIYAAGKLTIMPVVVETFRYEYHGGWGTDIIYNLLMWEYREMILQSIVLDRTDKLPGEIRGNLRPSLQTPDVITKPATQTSFFAARINDLALTELIQLQLAAHLKPGGKNVIGYSIYKGESIYQPSIREYIGDRIQQALTEIYSSARVLGRSVPFSEVDIRREIAAVIRTQDPNFTINSLNGHEIDQLVRNYRVIIQTSPPWVKTYLNPSTE